MSTVEMKAVFIIIEILVTVQKNLVVFEKNENVSEK